ncbi:unnamed protein product, partial [Mesorhabditis spiculigera]
MLPRTKMSSSVFSKNSKLTSSYSTPCLTEDDLAFMQHLNWPYQPPDPSVDPDLLLGMDICLYDPSGILIPVIIRSRIFMQQLWKFYSKWSDELGPEHQLEFEKLFSELQDEVLQLPRAIAFRADNESITLALFSDASNNAYACVAYLRVQSNSKVYVHHIRANFKLVPLHHRDRFTTPKVELLGMYLSAKSARFLVAKLDLAISSVHFHCDNTAVLGWLRNPPTKVGPFVRNRLRYIHETVSLFAAQGLISDFHYVATKENPADVATRGCTGRELVTDSNWLHGPPSLEQDPQSWPPFSSQPPPEPNDDLALAPDDPIEPSNLAHFAIHSQQILDNSDQPSVLPISRFSQFSTLLHVTTFLLTWRLLVLRKSNRALGSYRDLPKLAHDTIIRQHYLGTKLDLSALGSRGIHADSDGILRLHTRLGRAKLVDDMAKPIFILPKSPLLHLLIREAHNSVYHCGVKDTLAAFRRKYVTIGLRKKVESYLRHCVLCKKFNGKPYKYPGLDHLPLDRVFIQARPFNTVGLDNFFLTVNQRRRVVLLITCTVTRLIHLEISEDLTALAFIQSFKRFCSRRGVPAKVFADNGSNFRLGAQILAPEQPASGDFAQKIGSFMDNSGISFVFISPLSPWKGGFWERLNHSIKTVFYKNSLRTKALAKMDDASFLTLIIEIEGIVNSRPLTGRRDFDEIVRAIDFISPKALLNCPIDTSPDHWIPEISSIDHVKSLLNSYERFLKESREIFQSEYLLGLRTYHKQRLINTQGAHLPRVGDVVFIVEDNKPRRSWPLGYSLTIQSLQLNSYDVQHDRFLFDQIANISIVAPQKFKPILECPNRLLQNCTFIDRCTCLPADQSIACNCDYHRPRSLFSDLNLVLPLTTPDYLLATDANQQVVMQPLRFAASYSLEFTGFSFESQNMVNSLQAAQVQFISLEGCYDCQRGAIVSLLCQVNSTRPLPLYLECTNALQSATRLQFSVLCDQHGLLTNLLSSTPSTFNDNMPKQTAPKRKAKPPARAPSPAPAPVEDMDLDEVDHAAPPDDHLYLELDDDVLLADEPLADEPLDEDELVDAAIPEAPPAVRPAPPLFDPRAAPAAPLVPDHQEGAPPAVAPPPPPPGFAPLQPAAPALVQLPPAVGPLAPAPVVLAPGYVQISREQFEAYQAQVRANERRRAQENQRLQEQRAYIRQHGHPRITLATPENEGFGISPREEANIRQERGTCIGCSGNHGIRDCLVFATATERNALLVVRDICRNCLSHTLTNSRCRSGPKLCVCCCRENDDLEAAKHNTVLCPLFFTPRRAVYEKLKKYRPSSPDGTAFQQQRRRQA